MGKYTIEIRTEIGSLDLFQGAERSFYITRQIYDLHNFETRNADYSKTIRVPPTPNNIAILDAFVGVAQTNTIPCQIIMGGVTISSRAKLLFTKTTITNNTQGFDVIVFYGNFNLFDDLVEGTLDELNWADLSYQHTHPNYAALSTNLTGLCTPIVDWLTRDSPKVYGSSGFNVEINTGGFFIYAREIIDRIITEAGYTVTYSSTVNPDFFKTALACPVTKFFELADLDQVSFSSVRNKTADTSANLAIVRVVFDFFVSGVEALWDIPLNQWVVADDGDVTFEVRGTYTHIVNGIRPDSIIRLLHNGVPVDDIAVNGNVTDVDFFLTASVSALTGDILFCEIESFVVQSTVTVNTNAVISLATAGFAADRNIQPSEFIPQIDKSEFIVNLLKLYNLVMQTDDIEKAVSITAFNDVFTSEEQDLNSILDVGENAEITKVRSIDSLGQISKFTWENDNLLRRDIDFDLKFDNQLLAKEKTSIAMMFSACDNSIYLFDVNFDPNPRKAKIPNCRVIKDTQTGNVTMVVQSDGSYVLGEEEQLQVGMWCEILFNTLKSQYRIIEVNSPTTGKFQTPIAAGFINQANTFLTIIIQGEVADPAPRIAILDDSFQAGGTSAVDGSFYGGSGNLTQFPNEARSAIFPDRLLWKNIVVGNDWGSILDALQTPEVVKAWFNLPVAIFNELDFLRPVYIGDFNAFYYINKIEQFKLESKTRLELVRISTLT